MNTKLCENSTKLQKVTVGLLLLLVDKKSLTELKQQRHVTVEATVVQNSEELEVMHWQISSIKWVKNRQGKFQENWFKFEIARFELGGFNCEQIQQLIKAFWKPSRINLL